MATDRIGAAGRRDILKGLAAGTALAATGLRPGWVQAQSAEPIRLGFQVHRTGIGAAYGRWYQRTAEAALKVLNEGGGIAGRPVEIVFEDDGTDPKRGTEVVEKFASQNMDVVYGTLFSNVVMSSAARAGELTMPYLVCSEGHHVAAGAQPLDAAARHHRREEPGAVDGALGRGEPRQEGDDALPRLRLRLRPPRLLLQGDGGAGRRRCSS